MAKTYAIIDNGVVVNKILASSELIALKVSSNAAVAVEDSNGTYSIGDNYTE